MRGAAILFALLLASCGREASFDDRFADTQKSIADKARQMDAELAERERQAAEAAAPPTASPPVMPRR